MQERTSQFYEEVIYMRLPWPARTETITRSYVHANDLEHAIPYF